MERKVVKKLPEKIRKVVVAGRIIGIALVAAVTVYRLIPKDDKISGINTEKIVEKYSI